MEQVSSLRDYNCACYPLVDGLASIPKVCHPIGILHVRVFFRDSTRASCRSKFYTCVFFFGILHVVPI